MRLLMTGGSGVLGSASIPLLRDAGHTVEAPGRTELNLFDAGAVAAAVADMDAIAHLATRIPPPECLADREAWRDTDRLRAEATPILVDAALAASVEWFLFPSIAFVYPESGPVDESTPVAETVPEILLSALEAERHVARFDGDGRRGVVLRLGVLCGPSIGKETPAERWAAYGATLRIEDAGRAIAAAAEVPRRRLQRRQRRRAGLERALQRHRGLAARVLTLIIRSPFRVLLLIVARKATVADGAGDSWDNGPP